VILENELKILTEIGLFSSPNELFISKKKACRYNLNTPTSINFMNLILYLDING